MPRAMRFQTAAGSNAGPVGLWTPDSGFLFPCILSSLLQYIFMNEGKVWVDFLSLKKKLAESCGHETYCSVLLNKQAGGGGTYW